MSLYEWMGRDGHRYRMAAGIHAQHPIRPGQIYEVQIGDGRHWIPMEDWNQGVRPPLPATASTQEGAP